MKNTYTFLLLAILVSSNLCCSRAENELYISPEGNDLNRGGKNQPFASLNRALEEVSKLKAEGVYPEAGITIWLREGEYSLSESIELTQENSGLPGAPVKISDK